MGKGKGVQQFEVCGEYEVEAIVRKKIQNGITYYRIKWVGYKHSQNTWEPAINLPPELIEDYQRTQREKYDQKMKKQMEKKLKEFYPSNLDCNLQIQGHFFNSMDELMFNIEVRGKKLEVSRDNLMKRDSQKLCQYYIELAKQRGMY